MKNIQLTIEELRELSKRYSLTIQTDTKRPDYELCSFRYGTFPDGMENFEAQLSVEGGLIFLDNHDKSHMMTIALSSRAMGKCVAKTIEQSRK